MPQTPILYYTLPGSVGQHATNPRGGERKQTSRVDTRRKDRILYNGPAMPGYDEELMLRAAGGEAAAFRELFDRHYTRAVNIAYRMLADRDLAEDIAMDAFVRIYEARASYNPQAKFTTFLYRVVANLSINAARRARAVTQEPLDEARLQASSESDPAAELQRAEASREVRAAILNLPENQRMALVLTRYDEMSYEEAAEVMGVSLKAIESLLHRAKRNLRKTLEPGLSAQE